MTLAPSRTPIEAERGDSIFVALAPMDGVTDHSYRAVLSRLGQQLDPDGTRAELRGAGISICVSEFVRVTNQRVTDAVFMRHCPELARGGHTEEGVPVFVQLLGGAPEPMSAAAGRAAELGARGIDLNFGCPAKVVNRHDGGAALLKEPRRVEEVTRAVRAAVPPEIPVTVKIRLGWDSAEMVEDIAKAAEAGGGAWLTVHARTRTQLYKPPVDWVALGRAREAISIPLVANGDITSPEALARCKELSGCQHFMIGRGAMARPELFAQLRAPDLPRLGRAELAGLLLDYESQMARDGTGEGPRNGRMKQWLRMGGATHPWLAELFERYKRERSFEALSRCLRTELEPPRAA